MWRRSYTRQFGGVTRRAGSPDVQALGGQTGVELSRSGQPRGQTTRRAVAKANGLTAEISFRMKLIQAGYWSAKSFLLLLDGQCRCGRNGDVHAPGSPPGTFDLLGFTHYWGRSWKGYWVVKSKTAKDRFQRALARMAHWCRHNRHQPLAEQQHTLNQGLRGHYAYYGITNNGRALYRFRNAVVGLWRKWLSRRTGGGLRPWLWVNRLLQRYPLAPVVLVHSVYRRAANP